MSDALIGKNKPAGKRWDRGFLIRPMFATFRDKGVDTVPFLKEETAIKVAVEMTDAGFPCQIRPLEGHFIIIQNKDAVKYDERKEDNAHNIGRYHRPSMGHRTDVSGVE